MNTASKHVRVAVAGSSSNSTNAIWPLDEHDVYVFDPSVLTGPELWIDDTLQGAIFVSDQQTSALRTAKLVKGWLLKRCGISQVH